MLLSRGRRIEAGFSVLDFLLAAPAARSCHCKDAAGRNLQVATHKKPRKQQLLAARMQPQQQLAATRRRHYAAAEGPGARDCDCESEWLKVLGCRLVLCMMI